MRWINVANLQQVTAVQLLSDPGAIPGSVVIPNCAQVVLNWALEDGRPAHNVLYGRYTGVYPGTVAMANALFTAMSSGPGWAGIAPALAPSTSFTGVSLRDVNSPSQPLLTSTAAAVPGTGTGESLPNEVAAVITLRTALAGRQNRGRMYIPGFAVTATSAGNVISAGLVTALTTWGDGFRSIFAGQNLVWVIGQRERAAYTSPITGRVFPHRPASSQAITQAICKDNHWDSQRRRGLK